MNSPLWELGEISESIANNIGHELIIIEAVNGCVGDHYTILYTLSLFEILHDKKF